MPWWISAIGLGLRLLGLASWAEGLYARWQAKRQGREEQRAADVEAEAATLALERDALVQTASKSTSDALRDGTF